MTTIIRIYKILPLPWINGDRYRVHAWGSDWHLYTFTMYAITLPTLEMIQQWFVENHGSAIDLTELYDDSGVIG